MSQRVERIVISRSHPNWKACHRLCGLARRLGNCATYILRHLFIEKKDFPNRQTLDRELREQYPSDYRGMPSAASAQRQGQIIREQFLSFINAKAEYRKHPDKFKGEPKLPGYRKRYRTFYVNRNGFCIRKGLLHLSGQDKVGFTPMRVICSPEQDFNAPARSAKVGDVRIVPAGNSFILELTYEENRTFDYKLDSDHACVLDLGVENFIAAVATRPGLAPFLVKGGILKSLNQKYNKDMAQLRALEKTGHYSIRSFKRDRCMNDLLHKISRMVVNYCVANDLGVLIVGRSKDWKQQVCLGKRNNQNFVMIPHAKFIEMLQYKAQGCGITVILCEESYSSKASALDFDPVPNFGDAQIPKFSGRRIHRGLYRTGSGQLINADINGALNIGRKELGDEWLRKRLQVDEGAFVNAPTVYRHLHNCGHAGHCWKGDYGLPKPQS